MRWVLLGCVGLLLAAGCDEGAKHTLTPPAVPAYLVNDSPDNLVTNLIRAWEAEDAAGYAALLYDGVELAMDGQAYAPFKFYFNAPTNPDLPELWLYADELTCVEAMLGGEPGRGVPGIESVSMDLADIDDWGSIAGDNVEGDSFPEATLRRSYDTSMLFTLKSTIGDTDINQWVVVDRLVFHCIPVQAGGTTEWRLWKWTDVIDLRTEDASIGAIKALYGQ